MDELRVVLSFVLALAGFALALLSSARQGRGRRRGAGV